MPLLLPLFSVDEGPPCDDVGVGACEGVVWADEGAGESYNPPNKSQPSIPKPFSKIKKRVDSIYTLINEAELRLNTLSTSENAAFRLPPVIAVPVEPEIDKPPAPPPPRPEELLDPLM